MIPSKWAREHPWASTLVVVAVFILSLPVIVLYLVCGFVVDTVDEVAYRIEEWLKDPGI